MRVNIMSFNTLHCENYLKHEIDFDLMADTIKKCNADIVGLNEIRDKGVDEDYQAQTAILAEKLGYYGYFAKAIDVDGKNPYGNAILSKYPIVSAEKVMIPNPEGTNYEKRCVLKAIIDIGKTNLNVIVTHFGLYPAEAVNATKTVMDNLTENKTVLMGDFNVTPENEVLAPIRKAMIDTAELFDKELFSWPADNPDRKIDYIFISKDLKVLAADIPEIIASDHRPHTALIEVL